MTVTNCHWLFLGSTFKENVVSVVSHFDRFVSLDRKNRTLSLSVRAKDDAEIAEALKEYKQSNASSGTTSLGDLLKEQLDQDS